MSPPTYSKYCCDKMRQQAEHSCPKCSPDELCADRLIKTPDSKSPRYGMYLHDGGSSYVVIYSCPWCATYLYPDEGQNNKEQNKETNMEDERKKPIEGNIDSYREILEYSRRDHTVTLRLPSRAPIILQRYELVAIAMAAFNMLRHKFAGAAPQQVFDAIASVVSGEWKPTAQEVRDAGFLLNQELTLRAAGTFEMVCYTMTELVVYYKKDVPSLKAVEAFVQNLPASYRGVRVIAKAVP